MDLDIHAGTILLGGECMKIYNWNRPVKLSGYNPKDRESIFQAISGEFPYDHPHTGQVYLLIFHQFINANNIDHHLMCTMYCIIHGIDINETSIFY